MVIMFFIIKVSFANNAHLNCLKNSFKIYIKIDIITAPTCFDVITIIREHSYLILLKLLLLK